MSAPRPVQRPAQGGRRPTPSPQAWRRANGEWLEHALAALRYALGGHALALKAEAGGEPLAAHRARVVADEELERLLAPRPSRAVGEDPRAAELERRRRETDELAAAKERAMTATGAPPALAVLAERFGLGAFERWALLAAAAPELQPDLARLYAYANDDVARPWPTPWLLARLASSAGVEAPPPGVFAPGAALLGRRLLRRPADAAPPGPAALAPLAVDERVLAALTGDRALDPRLGHLLRAVGEPPATPAHGELAARLAESLAGHRLAPPAAVQLVGRTGSGRRSLAAATAARLGLDLLALELRRLPAGDEGREALALAAREALLTPAALYVEATAAPGEEDRLALERTAAALEVLDLLVFVGTRDPLRLERPGPVVPVPPLPAAARAELLLRALGPVAEDAELRAAAAAAAEQFELGPGEAVRAAAAARQEARLASGGAARVDARTLWTACRRRAGVELDDLALRIEPAADWDDLVLPTDAIGRLREIAGQVAHRATVYGAWGFAAKLTRGRGISALFSGPSGTGKTLAAEVLARHLDLDLYRVDLAGVVSKYIGETERNLRRVFDAAESGGGILFFDEADALFGRRTEVKDSHDRYANVEIDYLLQRMEEYRGLAILATNRKSALDRAFLRRLRFVLEFPFPDAAARRRIWRRALPEETPRATLDLDLLARLELAGGNIRNVAVNGAFLAAAAAEPVAMHHLAAAARAEYTKCEKAISTAELAALAAAGEGA